MTITLHALDVADPADAWAQAGFSVDTGGVCRVGDVGIRLLGRDRGVGIVGWALGGLPSSVSDVDGLPTTSVPVAPVVPVVAAPAAHANGVTAIDHVVLMSPDLGRTLESLAAIDAQPRRERAGELGGRPIRQIFYRFGAVILEVVGSPESTGDGPATLWGLTYTVDDIDATAAFFGDRTSPVKDAVQPGRRITTLRHYEFGMSVRTAMISASR